VTVMQMPTRFQWYQILRKHYQFPVFQAVRGAFWLAGKQIHVLTGSIR